MTSVAHGHPEPADHDSHGAHGEHAPAAHGEPAPAAHAEHGAPAAHGDHGSGDHGAGDQGTPAHGGHGNAKTLGNPHLGRNVGITMAVMGVLLAFSSALVGGERTELVSAMIEHTRTSGRFQAVSTKYRVLQSQLQQLHATMPRDSELKKNQAEIEKVEGDLAKLEADGKVPPDARIALHALRLETDRVINTVAPTRSDLLGLARLVRHYGKEREVARKWADSFEDTIKIHEAGAERFELASLFAEIGIVMASIALLLHSRNAWLTAIVIGCASVSILALTSFSTHMRLAKATQEIHEGEEAYKRTTENSTEEADDERLLKVVTGQEAEGAEHEHGGQHHESEHGQPEHGGEHGQPEHGSPTAEHGGEHH